MLAFQTRWAAAEPLIQPVLTKLAAKQYGEPLFGTVLTKAAELTSAKKDMDAAVAANDYPTAIPALDKAETAARELEQEFSAHGERLRAYQARLADAQRVIEPVKRKGEGKEYGHPMRAPLKELKERYTQFKKDAEDAAQGNDFDAAIAAIENAQRTAAELEPAFRVENGTAQAEYEAGRAEVDLVRTAIAGKKYGSPLGEHFAKAVPAFEAAVVDMETTARTGNYIMACDRLEKVREKKGDLATAGKAFGQFGRMELAAAVSVDEGIERGIYNGAAEALRNDFKTKYTAAKDAVNATKGGEAIREFATAYKALADLKAASNRLQKGAIDHLTNPRSGIGKGAAREQVLAFQAADPTFLNSVAEKPGGPAWIDSLVDDIGVLSRGKPATKTFLNAAFTARFGLKLTVLQGDSESLAAVGEEREAGLDMKYLEKLYGALKKVPATHTKQNRMLTEIKRSRDYTKAPHYEGGEKKEIILRFRLESDFEDWKKQKKFAKAGERWSFDAVTLHEVGHAVDAAKSFMDTHQGIAKYGGWQSVTKEQIADAVGEDKGFYARWSAPDAIRGVQLTRDFLKTYLMAVLSKSDPAAELAKRPDAPIGVPAVLTVLAADPAVTCCENMRMNGGKGLYTGNNAAQFAIGGLVYQESYADQWWSYTLSARGAKVSNYQFRAPGEWYAEAYSAFFLEGLPATHPLYPILDAERRAQS